ncbi:hypothetical protein C8R44DRAFT_989166 [Mycena epipterygia]|nr:hypothetical protein C8R44DRAFT_989166 [Mycena epipterygia]
MSRTALKRFVGLGHQFQSHFLPVFYFILDLSKIPLPADMDTSWRTKNDDGLTLLLQHQHVNLQNLPPGFQFRREDWTDLLRRMHRIAVRLDRLAEDSRVRSRKFNALGYRSPVWNSGDTAKFGLWDNTYRRAITTFSSTLGRYQQLRSLDINGFTIDTSFRQALVSLPMLEDLNRCDIVARDGALVKLKTFTISGFWLGSDIHQDPLTLVSPDRLHTLNIGNNTPETFTLLSGFPRGKFPHLVDLSLQGFRDIDLLFGFLKQCPRLEWLAIISIIPRHDTTSACAVAVSWEQEIQASELVRAFSDILCASVPLRSLVVIPAMTPQLFTTIMSLFPELRELSISIVEENHLGFGCSMCRTVPTAFDRAVPPLLSFAMTKRSTISLPKRYRMKKKKRSLRDL